MKKNNITVLNFKETRTPKDTFSYYAHNAVYLFFYCICALFLGIVTGAIDALFGIVLLQITDYRSENPYYFIPFLALSGLIIFYIYDRFGKETQSGMKLVFERAQNRRSEIRLRLIPFVTLSTWMTHLFGGSAGREGVAVQIGGTLGSFTAQKFIKRDKKSAEILTITGMAAGFGGLFRTPMAAIFFATEVISVGKIKVKALLPAFISAYTASFVSGYLGLEKFTVVSDITLNTDVQTIAALCMAGVFFGITGGSFAFALKKVKKLLSDLIPNPYVKIAAAGAVISIFSLLLYSGRYSGLGTNLIAAAVDGGEIYYWDFILKFVFTVVTLSAGYQGGEVTPLFAIGASLGAVLALIFNMPVLLFAALGYAAVFGAATNTLIAPIFIGVEVFGYQYIPYFFVVCVLAYITNGNNSIYSFESKNKVINIGNKRKIIIKQNK
ncbi:MAG: chloride channel protein [Clostridia bacterium]|nr:chloride channel protein [Clostridia bacterium]